jgi:glutaredoxin
LTSLTACRNNQPDASEQQDSPPGVATVGQSAGQKDGLSSQLVKPPFPVQGELEGLLLVWFDAQGLHTAHNRSEIPEAQRAHVRVDALDIAPDARLDPERVYVADLRTPGADGSYPVRQAARTWFDGQVDQAKPQPAEPAADESVVVYKASWCGVCRTAEAFLRSRHVPFVEKDVEKEPGASDEMLKKARAKGLSPRGVPVIDFHGEIMLGFDQAHLESLIKRYAKPI